MEKQNKITEDISKLIVDTNEVIETFNNQVDKINELQERIDKAIEYNNYFENAVKEELDLKQDYSIIIASYIGAFHDTLEEILKGSDT